MHNNLTAVDIFSALVKTAPGTKPTKSDVKIFANATMNAMGRGSFESQNLDTGVQLMNHLLISTRYLVSGINLVVGQPLLTSRGGYAGTGRARAKVAYEIYAKTLMSASIIMTVLGYMAFGDDEEKWKRFVNPLSNRFGVVNFNGVDYEPLKRITPYIAIMAKTAFGKKVTNGKVVPLRGEGVKFKGGLGEEWVNFINNRKAINLALVSEIVTWRQFDGTAPTASSIAAKTFGNLNIINDIAILQSEKQGPVQKAFTIALTHAGITTDLERAAKSSSTRSVNVFKVQKPKKKPAFKY